MDVDDDGLRGEREELLPSPRHGLGDLAIDEKLQSSAGLCSVGSAGSTGKSCVTYCPGRHARRISAPGSWAGAAARLPDQARSIAITALSAPNAGSVIVQRSPPSVHAEARSAAVSQSADGAGASLVDAIFVSVAIPGATAGTNIARLALLSVAGVAIAVRNQGLPRTGPVLRVPRVGRSVKAADTGGTTRY